MSLRGAIGFDYSHNNKLTLEGSGYADFTQFLFSSSFQLGKIQAGFDSIDKLKKYNLIMVSSPMNSKFAPEEIEVLQEYVKEGGNLLIISSSGSDYSNNTNLNDLTKNFGFEFELDEINDSMNYKFLQKRPVLTNLKPHFITEQVQRVVFSSACSIKTMDFLEDDENINIEKLILTGLNSWRRRYNGEEWVEEDCPKVPVLVIVEYYKGKVVAFGSLSIFSSIGREYGFSALENDVLIANILRWLAMGAYADKIKILNARINMDLFYWMEYLLKEQNWEDMSDVINVSLKYFKDNYKKIIDEITNKQMEKLEMKKKYEQEYQRKMQVSEEEKILDIVIERKKKDLIEIMEELEEITGEKYELSIDLEEEPEEEEVLDEQEKVDIEELQKDTLEKAPEVKKIIVEEEKLQVKEDLDEEFGKLEDTRKKFKKMTIQKLKHLCKENDIEIPNHAKKREIIDILLDYYSV